MPACKPMELPDAPSSIAGARPGTEGLRYRRVLIKLSGEAMVGETGFGIDVGTVARFADEVARVVEYGCQIAIVIGAGNVLRGRELTMAGIDRVTADQMGMLATVINCLAMQDALERCGLNARVMSAIQINEICEDYIRRRAVRHLEKGRVILLAAGTGNPFFTTDTAAGLRAIEIDAELMIKATKVDGVYSSNPLNDKNAERFPFLSYDDVLGRKLEVLDATAVVLCRDNGLPLRVLDMNRPDAILRAVEGSPVGTLIGMREQER